ncbi:NAD(+) diphosphatase [Consotaella salsifontis]|uniref:NAD(+) diphosphatase n=1 Tax=Consotaella salsifontis TaxID=1365950 RepID=A0A1T4RZW5_9HYPH|nr:NAD(+) diphosphatase [Consotaella salsifontis]SKA21505.1 NAD+ diphosphatase [Consotaella salsifontis]
MISEISERTGFAGNRIRRDSERRTEETLRLALADTETRAFLGGDAGWLVKHNGFFHDGLFSVEEARALHARIEEAVLLGTDIEGRPRLAIPAEAPAAPSDELAVIDLRTIGQQGLLDRDAEGQMAQAAHLLTWHRNNRFCGRCGSPTLSEAAGVRRRCPACEALFFPRTDPVTIMLVHDGAGRAILARQPRFKTLFWSCLAGFVEPGETMEHAVRRETHEEAGLEVGRVTYLASQPWPFPGSLMIGCIAEAATTEIDFDREELEDCRWFSRDEVIAMFEGRHPDGLTLPQPFAIAHHLIKAFAEGSF